MPANLLDCYVAIEAASVQMLEAAQSKDWGEVMRHEGACAVLIEQLRELGKNAQMSPTQRREKSRIMQQILRNDAQVRMLTEPWVAELDRLLRPEASGALH